MAEPHGCQVDQLAGFARHAKRRSVRETLPDRFRVEPGQRRYGPQRALGRSRIHHRLPARRRCRWRLSASTPLSGCGRITLNLTGAGLFDHWSFDPVAWKSDYPNPAFLLMDREDAFWAAKQVAAFSDAEIRALVETGEYSDPRAVGLDHRMPHQAPRQDCTSVALDQLCLGQVRGCGRDADFRTVRWNGTGVFDSLGSA